MANADGENLPPSEANAQSRQSTETVDQDDDDIEIVWEKKNVRLKHVHLKHTATNVVQGGVFAYVQKRYAKVLGRQAEAALPDSDIQRKMQDYERLVKAKNKHEFLVCDEKDCKNLLEEAKGEYEKDFKQAERAKKSFVRKDEKRAYILHIVRPREDRLRSIRDDVKLCQNLVLDLRQNIDDA